MERERKKLLILLCFISMAVGLLAVLGWIFNISILKSMIPGLPPMRFNAALSLILLSFSMYLLVIEKWKWIIRSFCILVLLYGIAVMFQFIGKISWGIDELFINDPHALAMGYPPGRPPVSVALCFILMASSFLVYGAGKEKWLVIAQFCMHLVTFISFIILLGFIFSFPSLSRLYFFTSMSIHMAAMLLLLSSGGSFIHADKGITSLFMGSKMGNEMARRMFPQMLLLLLIITYWRILAYQNNWVSEELGISLVTSSFVLIMIFLIWYNVKRLNLLDDKRRQIENEIIKLNHELKKTVKDLTDYKLALDAANIIFTADQHGNIQEVNDKFCQMTKYSREELIGKNPSIVNSGYHSREFFRNLWDTILAGKIYKAEHRNKAKDGTIYWVDATVVPFLDETGKPCKFLAVQNEITKRMLFLEELKKSEENYRNIFENTLVAIITSHPQTFKTIDVNENTVTLFGYKSKQDFLDRFESQNHYIEASERDDVRASITREGVIIDRTLAMKRLDGSRFWVKVFAKTVPVSNIIETSLIDVTNEVRYRDQLKEKIKELERVNKELESFNYMASHDLQEPLRKIMNFAGVIRQQELNNLTEQGKIYLDGMRQTAHQMRELINDLLSYSRIKKPANHFEKVDLNLILREVCAELKNNIQEKKASIEWMSLCEITGIRFQCHQLFYNLVNNALKFISPGRNPQINIKSETVSGKDIPGYNLQPERQYCHITMKDNGIGFDPKYNEKIFEIFMRLTTRDEYPGTGIGLAICKKIVENHHGIITAKGDPGKGAQFDIYIPC